MSKIILSQDNTFRSDKNYGCKTLGRLEYWIIGNNFPRFFHYSTIP
jgi:hypothetical protein